MGQPELLAAGGGLGAPGDGAAAAAPGRLNGALGARARGGAERRRLTSDSQDTGRPSHRLGAHPDGRTSRAQAAPQQVCALRPLAWPSTRIKGSQESLSGPIMDADDVAALLPAQVDASLLVTEDPPSECLVLKNVFDGHVEKWPEFYLDVKECIHEQCAQFGPVQHIHVDKNLGYVYLRFDSKRTSTSAHKAFHGSSFDGRLITATFMSSRLYDSMFPDFWA